MCEGVSEFKLCYIHVLMSVHVYTHIRTSLFSHIRVIKIISNARLLKLCVQVRMCE